MNNFDDALENPMVRLGASFCWLLAASTLLTPLLIRLFNLLGIFESFFYRRWWNLDRVAWIAIVLTLLLWVGLSILAGFDPTVWVGAAGAFFFWSVLVRNIAFELPDFLTKLVLLIDSVLSYGGLALGLLVLLGSAGTRSGVGTEFGSVAAHGTGSGSHPPAGPAQASAPAPATASGPSVQAPMAQSPTQPGPAPGPEQAAESRTAGWYPDPRGEATWRWFDGSAWTENTN